MSTGVEPTITLTKDGDWWVARDTETGVASQGRTRSDALDNLDEALEGYLAEGDEIGTWEAEKELLRDIGLDPEEIKAARETNDGLPEFMQ